MRRDGMWSDGIYKMHLDSLPASAQERDAAAIFVRELNTRNTSLALRFDCKPDEVERNAKTPDFLYVDAAAGVRVAIEVKRPLLTDPVSQRRWQTDLAAGVRRATHHRLRVGGLSRCRGPGI